MISYKKSGVIQNVLIRHTLFGSVVVFFVLVAIGVFFFLLPYYREGIRSKEWEIAALRKTLSEKESLLETLNAVGEYYETIPSEERERASQVLPKKPHFEELYTQIESMVMSHAMELESIEMKESKKEIVDGVGIIDIIVNVSPSSYENFKAMVADLEQNLRLMDIEQLKYAIDSGLNSVHLTTYFLSSK
jgi:Tfp pilus assembly protein PilO